MVMVLTGEVLVISPSLTVQVMLREAVEVLVVARVLGGVAAGMEHEKAEKALFWAAMTYVVAALGSVAQFLYFLSLALGRRD